MRRIRTGIVDEHDIFRRGLVACLSEDPSVEVILDAAHGSLDVDLDVGVVSSRAAVKFRFSFPLVVCAAEGSAPEHDAKNRVLAVLPRGTLTGEQLIGAVHAAAAGLQVRPDQPAGEGGLPPRLVHVLRLLADGADTQEISRSLNYSERTIKGLISEVQRELGVRSRAQAVAVGIRNGLI